MQTSREKKKAGSILPVTLGDKPHKLDLFLFFVFYIAVSSCGRNQILKTARSKTEQLQKENGEPGRGLGCAWPLL